MNYGQSLKIEEMKLYKREKILYRMDGLIMKWKNWLDMLQKSFKVKLINMKLSIK